MRAAISVCLLFGLISVGSSFGQPPAEMPEPTEATDIPRWRPFIWGVSNPPRYANRYAACMASFNSASSNDDEIIQGFDDVSWKLMSCRPAGIGNASRTTGTATLECPAGTKESFGEEKCIAEPQSCTAPGNPTSSRTINPIHITSGDRKSVV